jgi:hypothetical protein
MVAEGAVTTLRSPLVEVINDAVSEPRIGYPGRGSGGFLSSALDIIFNESSTIAASVNVKQTGRVLEPCGIIMHISEKVDSAVKMWGQTGRTPVFSKS